MSGHVIVVVVKSLRVGECKMEMGTEMKEVKSRKTKNSLSSLSSFYFLIFSSPCIACFYISFLSTFVAILSFSLYFHITYLYMFAFLLFKYGLPFLSFSVISYH